MILLFRNRDDVGAGLLKPSRHDHAEIPAAENENLSAGEAVPEIQKLLGLPGGKNTGGTRPGYRERADGTLAAAGGKNQALETKLRQARAGGQKGTTISGDGKNLRLRQQTDTGALQSREKKGGIFRSGYFRTEDGPAEAPVTALAEDTAGSRGSVHKNQVTDTRLPSGGSGGHPRGACTDDQKFTVFHLCLRTRGNPRRTV